MRIAFYQAHHHHKRFNENFMVVDRHFGVFPDIGLATAAAVARSWGAEVRLWDAYATEQPFSEVRGEMRRWGPDVIAGAFHSIPTFRETVDWGVRLSRELDARLVLGGHEASRYVREVMTHAGVDFLLRGRASVTLPAFLHAVSRDDGYDAVPGLVWRGPSGVEINAMPRDTGVVEDPWPARDLLPNGSYYSHLTQRRDYTVLMTSRGCPFDCAFCAVARSGYAPRPVDNVVDEMEASISELGIHEFDLFDSLLLHDRSRTLDLCGEIRTRKLDMEWACRSRIDDVDPEILRALGDAGCRRIYFGIESGDSEILERISKRIDLDRVAQSIRQTRDAGIQPLGFFQIGHRGETMASARRTIRFALDLPLNYAQFMRTIAKPGSDLERELIEVTGEDPWREYVLGQRDDARLSTPWTELSAVEIDGLVREAYLRFYLRPRIALRTLLRSRSGSEAGRYVRVGLEMLRRGADG